MSSSKHISINEITNTLSILYRDLTKGKAAIKDGDSETTKKKKIEGTADGESKHTEKDSSKKDEDLKTKIEGTTDGESKLTEEDSSKDQDSEKPEMEGGADDEAKKEGENEMSMLNQLDKACKELNYMIGAFKKLETFEVEISKPLDTLKANVRDILTDLKPPIRESVKQLIERNLKVLRGNITKMKIQIPLQHQVSGTNISEASGYLQTTVASKEAGYLPNPFEAIDKFESAPLLKEFQDQFKDLDTKLKLCLLCFAIFPENAEIKKRLLKFWWIGERLNVEEKGSVKETIPRLVEKGFIEPITKKNRSRPTSYKMHPIIRALIIRQAKKANFFDYDSKGYPTMDISKSRKSCLVKHEGPSWFSKSVASSTQKQQTETMGKEQRKQKQRQENNKKQSQEQKQRQNNEEKQRPKEKEQRQKEEDKKRDRDEKNKLKNLEPEEERDRDEKNKLKNLEPEEELDRDEKNKLKNLDDLQTLFNVSKQFPDLPEELFSKMKNIGVLCLGRWESTAKRHMEVDKADFLAGLKTMKKLRFFSLQGISGIKELPKEICNLSNLRVLDLRACHNLETLPKEVGSLMMLNYLDLSECYLLDNIPKKLSNLSKLKVLKGFVISKNSSCNLKDLKKLDNLEKLSINVNNDDFNIDDEGKVLFEFKVLRKLKIAWGAGGEGAPKSKKSNGKKANNGTKGQDNGHKEETGAFWWLQKLKISCGAESSKSISEDKVTVPAAAAKSGEVVKTQQDKTTNVMTQESTSDQVVKTSDKSGNAKQQANDGAPKPNVTKKPTLGNHKKHENDQQESGTSMLIKLDFQCFPGEKPPEWLGPDKLTNLERLYIRGGRLSNLGKSSMDCNKWKVETLRLKYLSHIKMDWKELQTQFPLLQTLEKVKCPQITSCPCDANGVWTDVELSLKKVGV